MQRNAAFTLLELLLTIAIIALLVALTLPALSATTAVKHKAVCASNLHQMGVGAFAYRSDHPMEDISVGAWQSALFPYLGQEQGVYICPAGQKQPDPVTNPPQFGVFIAGGVIPLEPGPRCWFVDRDTNMPAGWVEGTPPPGVAFEHPDVINLFEPHPIINEYEWVFSEQLEHDLDHLHDPDRAYVYSDVLLNFDPQGDGSVLVYPRKCTAGMNHLLIDLNTGQTLQEMHGPGIVERYPPIRINGGATHYGMNKLKSRAATDKMLIMDYNKTVADPADEWGDQPEFARHWGKVQALIGDGSMQLLSPDEIDPISPIAAHEYWGEPQ
jgi:prepilin-type N-terminal cleavage/methylation domain-containing protein